MHSADEAVIFCPPRQREWTIKVPVMATDTREVDPKYGRPDMSPHDLNLVLVVTLTLAAGLAVYALRNLLVESRCGAVSLGRSYLFPPLSSGGALVVRPWLRFHIPLIEPDVQISRIRLSDNSLPRKGCRVGLRIVLFEICSAFT